jgi:hypothetical protein
MKLFEVDNARFVGASLASRQPESSQQPNCKSLDDLSTGR